MTYTIIYDYLEHYIAYYEIENLGLLFGIFV